MKDPQVNRLYRWESRNGWDVSNISFAQAKRIIFHACHHYGVAHPEVRLHTTRSLPWSISELNLISLQRDRYLNIPVALHEATHHIVDHLHGSRPQEHGATFMGVYLDLLNLFYIRMHDNARAYGLKWTS